MSRCFFILSLACLFILSSGVPWSQTEQQRQAPAGEVSAQKTEKSDAKRPHSAEDKSSPHLQETVQRKSPQSSVYRPHDISIKSEKQGRDIDEILERPSVKLLDKRLPYGDSPAETTAQKPFRRKITDIEKAWHLYQQGRYDAAATKFSSLLKTSGKRRSLNARLGLAYTRLKQGQKSEARLLFQQLVKERYKISETLPAYLELLMETGDYEKVRSLISQLPSRKRPHWRRRVIEANLAADFEALPANFDDKDLSKFVGRNQTALDECIQPHIFFEVARRYHDVNADRRSAAISKKLLSCKIPRQLRHGILSLLADTVQSEESLSIVRKEKQIYASDSFAYRQKMDQLELMILKRRLNSLPEGSEERFESADAILAYSPDDPNALSVLAWHKLNHEDYRGAAELFSRLCQMQPNVKSHALGLGYCRLNLGELDTALVPLQEMDISDDSETLALKKKVYEKKANQAYAKQNWEQAADNFEKVFMIDQEDEDAKRLLAWTRYHQERYAEARTLMEESYESNKNPEIAGQLLDIYAGTKADKAAYDLARNLSQETHPASRALAADFYFMRHAPITVAQIANSPEKCYFNAFSPRLEAFLYHGNKDGDSGFSKLEETAVPITAVLPVKVGKVWSFSVTPKHLSSGNAPNQPFAGRFFRFLNGTPQLNDLEDSVSVWQPDIGFEKEGRISTAIHVGTTPFNGAVDPTPTFDVKLSGSNWFVDVHRWNVKDSILSYVGLEDPYGSSKWGRVTRNGISGGYTWSIFTDYWLSGTLGYNFYDGKNLWNNDSYHFNIAAGRTFFRNRDELSYGLFFTAQHYRRNSDFFTFGHGGYYSPQVMTMVGPFFRYRSALCRDYWFDFQAAVGWLHQQQDESPIYPRFNEDITGLNPAAAANVLGDYDSKTDNELGYSFHLQGMKLLNERFAAGGFAKLEKNTEYTEFQIGAGIQFFFDPQKLFWARKDLFNEFGRNTNK